MSTSKSSTVSSSSGSSSSIITEGVYEEEEYIEEEELLEEEVIEEDELLEEEVIEEDEFMDEDEFTEEETIEEEYIEEVISQKSGSLVEQHDEKDTKSSRGTKQAASLEDVNVAKPNDSNKAIFGKETSQSTETIVKEKHVDIQTKSRSHAKQEGSEDALSYVPSSADVGAMVPTKNENQVSVDSDNFQWVVSGYSMPRAKELNALEIKDPPGENMTFQPSAVETCANVIPESWVPRMEKKKSSAQPAVSVEDLFMSSRAGTAAKELPPQWSGASSQYSWSWVPPPSSTTIPPPSSTPTPTQVSVPSSGDGYSSSSSSYSWSSKLKETKEEKGASPKSKESAGEEKGASSKSTESSGEEKDFSSKSKESSSGDSSPSQAFLESTKKDESSSENTEQLFSTREIDKEDSESEEDSSDESTEYDEEEACADGCVPNDEFVLFEDEIFAPSCGVLVLLVLLIVCVLQAIAFGLYFAFRT